jgi:FemAB-related protein (PEP-CTERM system-associated)
MISTTEQFDGALIAEVRGYLAAAGPDAGVCGEHDPRWLSVLKNGLDHRPMMVISRDGDRDDGPIDGYLPLALVATRLFGRFLVSLPYLNRAGVVASDPAVRDALIDQAIELARIHNVQYLELRHEIKAAHDALGQQRDEKVRMVLDLANDADGLWKRIPSKVRNQIRKGDKHELSVRWGGCEILDDFYNVFAVNMRDLGTPVYGKRLFSEIVTQLQGDAELCVVDCQGKPIATSLLIHDAHDRVTSVPSASCLRQFNRTNANMWMYYQLLRRAVERGSARFDFGRSSVDSGTFKFKKQWGATPHPTVWQYHVRRGDINAVRPDSPKYRRRIETWQKLPVWLTRLVGPTIVRGIP